MLYILCNGFLYNVFGIAPPLRRLRNEAWYICQGGRRVKFGMEAAGLIFVEQKVLSRWRGRPVLCQWTARKPA